MRYFLVELAPGDRLKRISDAALARLRAYPWPGNVRELRNAVSRALVLAETDVLHADAFDLGTKAQTVAAEASLVDVERESILRALREANGSRLLAAKSLGIARSTLYRKLEGYDITEEEIRGMKR